MEANLSRVETKLDAHVEKVDQRLARQGDSVSEKLDEIRREMQLNRLAMNELYVTRHEYQDLKTEIETVRRESKDSLDVAHKERREELSRVNQALIASGLYFVGSLVLHFLPSIPGLGK